MRLAYCTNVHAGSSLAGVEQNLASHAINVRASLLASGDWQSHETLGLGLWFSEQASLELIQSNHLERMRSWLEAHQFIAFTMNGFPQGDFHQMVVKHRVYQPTWWQRERLDYTLRLIRIQDALLKPGEVGSISTLPIAWSEPSPSEDQWKEAARNLLLIADHLAELEERTGRHIVLAIEPEPGCALTDSKSLRHFFEGRLLKDAKRRERVCRYLTVCHDVCHAAVMFENQGDELKSLAQLGLRVGKVQVSSAIEVNWDSMENSKKTSVVAYLKRFAEDRYLHQTNVRENQEKQAILHEDLPQLLASIHDERALKGTWRIHFHVPIFYDRVGELGTTRSEIDTCLSVLGSNTDMFTGHFEVETYAWSVLPKELQGRALAEDIADELRYFRKKLSP
jgi:hypothetical protein